jgi:hypothetical protein
MKRLNWTLIIVFIFGLTFGGFAETKKEKNIRNGPIVTTWSKIKELFE